jgi:hypothetical protein
MGHNAMASDVGFQNAANASPQALANAAPNSVVGQIAAEHAEENAETAETTQ